MPTKTYCYQFSEQRVFASECAPLSFQISGNYAIVAMNNYTVGVYDISDSHFTLINLFPVCGCVIKIDYCVFDDYIITLESKDHTDANSTVNNSIRSYHNWRNGGTQNKLRFRAALGFRSSNSSAHLGNSEIINILGESPFVENVVDVLEFLHLNHPKCFSIYTNVERNTSTSSKMPNQNFDEMSSNIAISESTYVHLYRFCQPFRRSYSSHSGLLSPKLSKSKTNEIETSTNDNTFCYQHLFTVNFSFPVHNLCLLSRVLVAASVDKVQAIQMLEEKQKSDMFSSKMGKSYHSDVSQIEIDVEKCWLTSISNARKGAATKSKLKPKEILGPTQNLDTASITLLRYADSKEMSFETLLFRKYMTSMSTSHVLNIHLMKVPDFDKLGLFIVLKHEIILYSFCLKTSEVSKIAEYNFGNETVLSMAFSENVNLMHVAFSNGELVTYSSRLCATDLFESQIISKRVTLTLLGKVTLIGLTDIKSSGSFVCACCKFNCTEENEIENVVIVSPDSWNFYLFSQPLKSDLKNSIIAYANYKGNKKLLQMLMCSLLVFPSKEEVNNKYIEDIIICCLKSESFYMELVPSLLLRESLTIIDALKIFQILETKELYDDRLFELYAKQKLIKANFIGLNEEHFRWIVIKILQCSINLLFDIITTNNVENFLKSDLMTIEGLNSITFESIFIKILYYSAHTDYDLVQPLLAQLDQKEIKKLVKSQSHLIYNNKHHTSFGWVLNLFEPQIYAKIVASCFLNETGDNHELTHLEIAKQVGQCTHMLVLEEILRKSLKKIGLIANSERYCKIKFAKEKRDSLNISHRIINEYSKPIAIDDSYKNYINQLFFLYYEFSFNVVEFCLHKSSQLCRKIPPWLQSLRYHNILNQFYPFNGVDPFTSNHNADDLCPSKCCQSYLLRLQCLMCWKESSKFAAKTVIEASCESMSHPAWKSLYFLLLQNTSLEHRNIPEIMDFIYSLERCKDGNIIELYFSHFACEIQINDWMKIIEFRSNAITLNKILKYASASKSLNEFINMMFVLKTSNIITEKEYYEWVERSGRRNYQNNLFSSLLKQAIEEST